MRRFEQVWKNGHCRITAVDMLWTMPWTFSSTRAGESPAPARTKTFVGIIGAGHGQRSNRDEAKGGLLVGAPFFASATGRWSGHSQGTLTTLTPCFLYLSQGSQGSQGKKERS